MSAFEAAVPHSENSKSSEVEASTEDKHVALQLWWERNGEAMSEWFNKMSSEKKVLLLKQASPDIPQESAGKRELAGEKLNASDVLLPELTIDGLIDGEEHSLSSFFSRRCQADRCYFADIQLLNKMFAVGSMPLFSNGALKGNQASFISFYYLHLPLSHLLNASLRSPFILVTQFILVILFALFITLFSSLSSLSSFSSVFSVPSLSSFSSPLSPYSFLSIDMDTPFVDPADEDENVRSLSKDTTQEGRATVIAHLITGVLDC